MDSYADLVEAMRNGYDAFNRGDLDVLISFCVPGAVYDASDAGTGVFEGVDAIRGFLEGWRAAFEDYALEVEEIVDLGSGVVFATHRESGRPAGGTARVAQRRALVALAQGARVEWLKAYTDIDEARAAAERLARERASTLSRRNLEVHHRGVEAINARDLSDELFAELCTPDYRMENTSTAVTDKSYHGAAGVRAWISDFFTAFDEGARFESEEIVADGDEFVVSVVRIVGQGARSGAPLVLRWVNVEWFRAGRMTRAVGYLSRSEALKAVGLEQ